MRYPLSMFLRLPVAIVFIVAGASKWWSADDLIRVLLSAGSSVWVANGVAWVLPPLEGAIGVSLLLDQRARAGSHVLALCSLFAFSGFLLWLHVSGRNTGCGCFGNLGLDSDSAIWSVARNLALAALATASLVLSRSADVPDQQGKGESA